MILNSFLVVLFFFLKELNLMYSITITGLITQNEYPQACSNMPSPVPLSKAWLFLCLLTLFFNYKLDVFYRIAHHHFKLNMSS